MSAIEYGIVRRFSTVGERSGHLFVLDEHGNQTGEQLFMHVNDAVYPGLDESLRIAHTDETERGCQRLRLPRPGERIVFLRGYDDYDRPCAARWTFSELWDEAEYQLLTVPRAWRLIRETWRDRPHQDYPGAIIDIVSDVTSVYVMKTGSALLSEVKSWNGVALNLYRVDNYGDSSEYTSYETQVQAENGNWHTVRLVGPIEDYEYQDCCPDGFGACCQVDVEG